MPRGEDYSQGLTSIRLPVLAAAGSADTTDPAPGCRRLFETIGSDRKMFLELGTAYGYRRDYQHVDMLIGADAEAEIWPELRDWLEALA